MTPIQRRFSAGEVDPRLYAGNDLQKYVLGLRTCRNAIVQKHGTLANRVGSQYISEGSGDASVGYPLGSSGLKLIPFILDDDNSFVIVFSDSTIRFLKNGSEVTVGAPVTITGITAANPPVVTSAAHGYSDGDVVKISGVAGMTELNGRVFLVDGVTPNTFDLLDNYGNTIDASGYTAYTSGGQADEIYSLLTSYLSQDFPKLKAIQNESTITLTHPDFHPKELVRVADNNWTLTDIAFGPSLTMTNATVANVGVAGTTTYNYEVTAVSELNGDESLGDPAQTTTGNATLDATNYNQLTWTTVTGALYYNVYRQKVGTDAELFFIGSTVAVTFNDIGFSADLGVTPPENFDPYPSTNNYPSTATYFQQRRFFANTNTEPETVRGSRIGSFSNFISFPVTDDAALKFKAAGRQNNAVYHFIDIGKLVIFTSSGELVAEGGDNNVITPTTINLKQYSYNGSAQNLAPIVIDNTALYVQNRGSIVRDLAYNFESDAYRGNDLTIYNSHLVDGYTIADWAYGQTPDSIVWMAREDGVLLGLTYIREQQILGWHRHDFTDGYVENVCSVPEPREDAIYVVVRRTLNGQVRRYIERLSLREKTEDAIYDQRLDSEVLIQREIYKAHDYRFMDSHLTYDGRSFFNSPTMTLSTGAGWTISDSLTLTASSGYFVSTDVGNQMFLCDSAGVLLRVTITAYTSATVVTVTPSNTVQTLLRNTATRIWAKAVDEVAGLWHLEGQDVAVYADGFVVANPNNEKYDVVTVTNGKITLDKPYSVIHVGLPFTTDIETLDIDNPSGQSMIDKRKLASRVSMYVYKTRGLFVGDKPPTDDDVDNLENLTEVKVREFEGYDKSVELLTGVMEVNIQGNWTDSGRVFIRQVDPVPVSILAIAPGGLYPVNGG